MYSGDELVGFALLFPFAGDFDDESIPEPGTERGMVLVRLMIDARFQGRGYGRDALEAIVENVRDRGLPTIRLSVVPENEQALEVLLAATDSPRRERSTAARSSWNAGSRLRALPRPREEDGPFSSQGRSRLRHRVRGEVRALEVRVFLGRLSE